jgi:hypothetical protein
MSLEQELEGVTNPVIDSPDDHSADDNLPTDVNGPDDDVDAAESEGDGAAPEPKKQDRTIENVRGELLRKLQEESATTRQLLTQVMQLVQANAAPVQSKKAATIDDYSIEELEAQRGQLPDEKRAELDTYLIKRRIDEGIRSGLNAVQEEQKYRDERRRANQLAMDRFPQLSNRGSELYAEVNRRLSTLDPNYRKYNPRIVLNLADDVASELGIQARKTNPRLRVTTGPSSIRSERPVAKSEQLENVIDGAEEFDKISKRLQHALKGGKFDRAKIMKRGEALAAQISVRKEQ